jgi:hypothetical protein
MILILLTATFGEDGYGGKEEELRRLRVSFEEACWTLKHRPELHNINISRS